MTNTEAISQILRFGVAISYMAVMTLLLLFAIHRLSLLFRLRSHSRKNDTPDLENSRKKCLDIFQKKLPKVAVQLPIYNEYNVIKRLLRAVYQLDYPRHLLEIQVLDDSDDKSSKLIAALCKLGRKKGLNVRLLRRENRVGFKAGALSYGMEQSDAEFYLILDADFVPVKGLIYQLLCAFDHPRVAAAQGRWEHLNREQSLLTRLQAIWLDAHFHLEQEARSRAGLFLNFNGTLGMWRGQAIDDAGAWSADTLTEDLDLSYRAQLRGWQIRYLNEVSSPAELPKNIKAYKSQQKRWSKGSAQVFIKLIKKIMLSRQSFEIKYESLMHLAGNFTYLILLAIAMLMHLSLNDFFVSDYFVKILSYPTFALAWLSFSLFYFIAQGKQKPSKTPFFLQIFQADFWRKIFNIPLLLAMGAGMAINNGFAVIEAMLGLQSPFVRTPKDGDDKPKKTYKYAVDKLLLLEIIMSANFCFLLLKSIIENNWQITLFCALYFFGFLYIGGSSALRTLAPKFGSKLKNNSAKWAA